MSKIHRSILVIWVCSLVWLAGCTKTTTIVEVQPPSTGKIEGSVQLEEMDCTPSASSAGVTVNLLGTTYSAITDSAGNFALDSVPAGIYTIHFTKSGFGDYFLHQYSFVGAGIAHVTAKMGRIRNWRVTLSSVGFIVGFNSPDSLYYLVDTPTVVDSANIDRAQVSSIVYFVGRHPAINYADTNSWFASINAGGIPGGLLLSGSQAKPTDTLYLIGYPAACSGPEWTYYSGDTLKTVFTGLGPPSNVVKFVIP